MKTKIKKAAFYLLAVMLSGCVPSLHPLFTESELVADANLAGIWSVGDSNETWEFKQAGKGYECIYVEKGKIGRFDAGLGKLGNDMFLDVYPKELNLTENDFYKMHFVPAHTFMRVNLAKNSLQLRPMSPDGLEKLLKSDPNVIIKHEEPKGGGIVLTAPTKELQDFLLKYGIDEKYELFGETKEADKMHRIRAAKPQDANDKQIQK